MKPIVQNGDPVLRMTAKEVGVPDIGSKEIEGVIRDMKTTLSAEDRGVALAAPQIGVSLRIFIVAGKIFADEENGNDLVFINPEIVETPGKPEWMSEGCLSCGATYGQIERYPEVRIRAYNEKGERVEIVGKNLLAQIFQHETDHLNGVLFIDKAKDLEEVDLDDNPKNRGLGEDKPETQNV